MLSLSVSTLNECTSVDRKKIISHCPLELLPYIIIRQQFKLAVTYYFLPIREFGLVETQNSGTFIQCGHTKRWHTYIIVLCWLF